MKNTLLILFVLGFAASCSTMTKEDCRDGDWNTQGFEDAAHGRPKGDFDRHAATCKDFGYPVDEEMYARGYEKGLERFCTYKRGYKFGLADETYRDTCPEESEPEFYKGYTAGKQERKLDKAAQERRNRELRSTSDDEGDK